jgi:hypothetical protein
MPDIADLRAALSTLVDYVQRLGVEVRLEPRNGRPHDAKYEPPEGDRGPFIVIWCDPDSPSELQRRASQLAHECGHHLSYVADWRTEAYLAAEHRRKNYCNFELTPEERGLIFHEECVAWRIGQVVLKACRVELSEFESHWCEGLERYCRNMAVTTDPAKKTEVGAADKLARHHLYETPSGHALLASLGIFPTRKPLRSRPRIAPKRMRYTARPRSIQNPRRR